MSGTFNIHLKTPYTLKSQSQNIILSVLKEKGNIVIVLKDFFPKNSLYLQYFATFIEGFKMGPHLI